VSERSVGGVMTEECEESYDRAKQAASEIANAWLHPLLNQPTQLILVKRFICAYYKRASLHFARRSSALAPFGGTKGSGIGREGSEEGWSSYVETKYVRVAILE